MKRRYISFILVLISLFFVLVSCGKNNSSDEISELKSQVVELQSMLSNNTTVVPATPPDISTNTTAIIVQPTIKATEKPVTNDKKAEKTITEAPKMIVSRVDSLITRTKNQKAVATTKAVSISISDISLDYEIQPPNSIGAVYMTSTYTNNSKYTITGLKYKILLKDENKTTYLMNYDTIMPGETSAVFDSFGPKSLSYDDVEFLKCNITALNDSGKKVFIEYDYKLKTYKVV